MRGLLFRSIAVLAVLTAGVGTLLLIHASMPGWYARWWYPLQHDHLITESARRHQLDPALVAAVIYQESSFDSSRVSEAGARGLMQIMPSTAQWIGVQSNSPVSTGDDLHEPAMNIALGCWYLRYLIDRYGSTEAALAAYNGGAENVDKWIAETRAIGRDFNIVLDIPYKETRDYVISVMERREIYARAYAGELGAQP